MNTPIEVEQLSDYGFHVVQHSIVANVDALTAICDRLEAGLTSTVATRRRLLDALLAEAVAPSNARELEAAE